MVKPFALALARIFAASAFVTTKRKIASRLWLSAISGLPARFPITASFWYYLYHHKYALSTVILGHPLTYPDPAKAKVLPQPDARQALLVLVANLGSISGLLKDPGDLHL